MTPTPTTASQPKSDEDFSLHRCECRYRTILGSYGIDQSGQYVYKILWRDRITIVYFGVFAVMCRDCKRWSRVRMLPKEKRVDLQPMRPRNVSLDT